jgi:tRNA threonylcarbamoyladenosine biosynthesis protein TsaB
MTTILAIDTATDACSVALYRNGYYSELYEECPRQHSTRLIPMLQELLPDGDLRAQGIEAIAYGCGPGSFTGLRIAASAVQGLAFANDLPAIAVSTLACQVQTALRKGLVQPDSGVLSMLDARINEVYWSVFDFINGVPRERAGPFVSAPAEVSLPAEFAVAQGVGNGFTHLAALPEPLARELLRISPQILPSARDLIPLALESYSRGEVQRASEVLPVYVRDEISWKKLADQGKPV